MTRANNTSITVADVWGTVVYALRNGFANPPTQTYTFTRSAGGNAGSGTGTIAKGTLALDYGVSGNGYYEVTAVDGTNGANSPYAQIVTWTTHPATGCAVKTRFGNLAGITSVNWGALSGYGFYGSKIYLEGDCYINGDLTFTNQGSIAISGFNNDAGFITSAAAGNKTFYAATAPTVADDGLKVGDFWFDTSGASYVMKRCKTITPSVTWDITSVYMDGSGVYAGNITAGQVTSGTFTGLTFQTSASGKRVEITHSDNRITFYSPTGWTSGYIEGYEIGILPFMKLHSDSSWSIEGDIELSNNLYGNTIYFVNGVNHIGLYAASATLLHCDQYLDATGYKINNVALTYSDVGAAASGHTHSGVYAPAAQGAAFGSSAGSVWVSAGSSWSAQECHLIPITINGTTYYALDPL